MIGFVSENNFINMNYISWNYRGISFFKEEIIHFDGKNDNEFPSIKDFQQNGIYTSEIRNKLCNYLENCPEIVSKRTVK